MSDGVMAPQYIRYPHIVINGPYLDRDDTSPNRLLQGFPCTACLYRYRAVRSPGPRPRPSSSTTNRPMALATTLSPALTARVALMGRRVQAPRAAARPRPLAAGRRALVTTATFTKVGTKAELDAAGGRLVVETEFAGKLLIQDFMGDIFAISNKCPHLGISMQGKTPVLSAEMKDDGVIVCPAHKSVCSCATFHQVDEAVGTVRGRRGAALHARLDVEI